MPNVLPTERLLVRRLSFPGFFHVVARYGYLASGAPPPTHTLFFLGGERGSGVRPLGPLPAGACVPAAPPGAPLHRQDVADQGPEFMALVAQVGEGGGMCVCVCVCVCVVVVVGGTGGPAWSGEPICLAPPRPPPPAGDPRVPGG